MASIKDIAADLGVSTTTVSLALSGKHHNGRISKAMVERVQESAKRLNYHPNMIAKSLKLGSSKSIGLIVADITNPYFAQLVFVVQNYLEQFGYTILIMNTNENVDQMGRTITMLRDRRVDGFIIVATSGGEKYIKNLISQNIPLVLMDRYYPSVASCNVLSDNYSAMFESIDRLVAMGHKRICLITIDNDMVQISERQRGYCEAMAHHGLLRKEDIYVVDYDSPQEEMEQAIESIISQEGCDTIIFAINRLSSIGAKILTRRGVVIGEDVEVVYFDNSHVFDLQPKPVAHIVQPIEEVGNMAAKLLLQQIDKSAEFEPATHLLKCQLVDF